jgi:hypothetical protein
MVQKLRVLQSLWAMERRLADEPEWPLQIQLAMISDAGFDGAGVRFIDPDFARQATSFLRDRRRLAARTCLGRDRLSSPLAVDQIDQRRFVVVLELLRLEPFISKIPMLDSMERSASGVLSTSGLTAVTT